MGLIPSLFLFGGTMEDICKHKDCSCENVGLGDCVKLQELNDLQIRPKMRAILKAEWCNLPEAIRRAFYGVWCVLKNIINQLCYILSKLECLEAKVSNLCEVAKCQDERISGLIDHIKGKMLENVAFSMKSSGSNVDYNGQQTYTKISTQNDGSFTLTWNMVDENEVGKGTITGKVAHMYTMKDDGTIDAHISRVTFNAITYTASPGARSYGTTARYSIIDNNGKEIFGRDYDPGFSFSDKSPELSVGKSVTLQPQGGNTGDVLLFRTVDYWVNASTNGEVRANYVNNNSPLPKAQGCVIECDNC